MQVTSTASTRPAQSPPAHATDADPSADGESFASLLGSPAEPAPRAKTTGSLRERQPAKAEPARSPRSAGADAAQRTSTPDGDAATRARSTGEAIAAAEGVGAGDGTEGTDGRTLHSEAEAGGTNEASMRDWLATLIQWPAAPIAPNAPTETPAQTARSDPPTADATPPDARCAATLAMDSVPGATETPPWSPQNRPGPDLPPAATLDTRPLRADGHDAMSSKSASAERADSASGAHRGHRGMDIGRDAARASDEFLARNPPADLTPTPGHSELPTEVAALAAGLQGGARALTVPGTPADAGAMPPAAPAAVTDRAPVAEAAPVGVPMSTPLDDPRFAQALGTQVSLLARDGVHEASLQLNPAEMGPVSVQIVLDGTQARVEFGADMARTREVIERSLPELAAALREAGLTLSGGSVSQHQAGRGERQADPDDQRGRGGPERADRTSAVASDPQATPTRRWVRQGGLDLYA